MKNGISDNIRHIADGAGGIVAFGALFDLLPDVAALLSVIWFAIRIYESKTVQRLLYGDAVDKQARR